MLDIKRGFESAIVATSFGAIVMNQIVSPNYVTLHFTLDDGDSEIYQLQHERVAHSEYSGDHIPVEAMMSLVRDTLYIIKLASMFSFDEVKALLVEMVMVEKNGGFPVMPSDEGIRVAYNHWEALEKRGVTIEQLLSAMDDMQSYIES